jgi:hypothetical protein
MRAYRDLPRPMHQGLEGLNVNVVFAVNSEQVNKIAVVLFDLRYQVTEG